MGIGGSDSALRDLLMLTCLVDPQQGRDKVRGKGYCMVGIHVHSLEHGMSAQKARKETDHPASGTGSLPTMCVPEEGPGTWLRVLLVTPRSQLLGLERGSVCSTLKWVHGYWTVQSSCLGFSQGAV